MCVRVCLRLTVGGRAEQMAHPLPAEKSTIMVRFGSGQDRDSATEWMPSSSGARIFCLPCLATPCPSPIDLTGLSRADLSRFPLGEARPGQPDQAKGVAAWDRMGLLVGAARVGDAIVNWSRPGHKSMRLLVTRTYLFRRFLSVLCCQCEWREDLVGVGKGERLFAGWRSRVGCRRI